jgi:hypothetical protein
MKKEGSAISVCTAPARTRLTLRENVHIRLDGSSVRVFDTDTGASLLTPATRPRPVTLRLKALLRLRALAERVAAARLWTVASRSAGSAVHANFMGCRQRIGRRAPVGCGRGRRHE